MALYNSFSVIQVSGSSKVSIVFENTLFHTFLDQNVHWSCRAKSVGMPPPLERMHTVSLTAS